MEARCGTQTDQSPRHHRETRREDFRRSKCHYFCGIARHHRFILCLSHLVLTEVKTLSEGDIVLGLIRLPTRFRGRATHRKGTRFYPEHFQLDGGIEVGVVGGFLNRKFLIHASMVGAEIIQGTVIVRRNSHGYLATRSG